jgi:hypothetical protein
MTIVSLKRRRRRIRRPWTQGVPRLCGSDAICPRQILRLARQPLRHEVVECYGRQHSRLTRLVRLRERKRHVGTLRAVLRFRRVQGRPGVVVLPFRSGRGGTLAAAGPLHVHGAIFLHAQNELRTSVPTHGQQKQRPQDETPKGAPSAVQ